MMQSSYSGCSSSLPSALVSLHVWRRKVGAVTLQVNNALTSSTAERDISNTKCEMLCNHRKRYIILEFSIIYVIFFKNEVQ